MNRSRPVGGVGPVVVVHIYVRNVIRHTTLSALVILSSETLYSSEASDGGLFSLNKVEFANCVEMRAGKLDGNESKLETSLVCCLGNETRRELWRTEQ